MFKQINFYWRIMATGMSFLLFGLGGLILRIIVFPILYIFIWKKTLRIVVARNTIRFAFRGFIEFMRLFGVLSYNLHGLERLERKGLLILANHPTLLDTVFLMAFVKHADCIVKSSLWNNPFTRGPVRAAGYICNNNGPSLIADCINALHNGNNLIIFPEGTRTPTHGKMTLKRGAANIAARGLCNVTPIIINCTPRTLCKGEKWWQVPPTMMHFTITIQEDIAIQDFFADKDDKILAARHLTTFLQNYFMKENLRHASA